MAKKRVSLTIEQKLVDKVDSEAKDRGINRSQMMEDIIDSYFRGKGIDTAVILCGDSDTLTLNEYEGRPVLEHILEQVSSEGISRVILLASRNRRSIEEEFGSSYDGMALEYVEEPEPSGTATALLEIEERVAGPFAVLNGHVVADVDLKEMLKAHRDEGAEVTMALTTVEDPSSYGVAKLKGRKVLGFEEKPERGEEPSRLINAGTYIMEPSIFEMIEEGSIEAVFEALADEGLLYGYIYGGDWIDITEG